MPRIGDLMSGFSDFEYLYRYLGLIESASTAAKISGVCFVLGVLWHSLLRDIDYISSVVRVFLAVLLTAPVLYPWYILWVLPGILFCRKDEISRYVIGLSCTSLLSYEVLGHPRRWALPWYVLMIEFLLPFFLVLLFRSKYELNASQ